jgi:hypothetical protein
VARRVRGSLGSTSLFGEMLVAAAAMCSDLLELWIEGKNKGGRGMDLPAAGGYGLCA